MKNLKKLGLVFGVCTISAACFSLGACSSDNSSGGTGNTAGTTAPGGTAAGTSTGGTGTGGTSAGTSTGGTAGTSAGGTSSAGTSSGGTGGASGGSGGASGGTGGASGGSGGASGGTGGASGGTGGGGGTGGAAPSADCMQWCQGPSGLIQKCMGSNLLNPAVNTEEKCLAYCAKPEAAAGMSCWLMHLGFIASAADQDPHCGHASGDPGNNGPCTAINN